MLSYELVEHRGADMESRYYINGRRVLQHDFASMENAAHVYAEDYLGEARTSGRQVSNNRIRRTNRRTIGLPAHIARSLPLVGFSA